MAKFNGHKNWNHWNVSLWINNDEALYQLALACIFDTKQCGAGYTRKDAAAFMLDLLEQDGTTKTPDGAPYSVSSIRAAMVGM